MKANTAPMRSAQFKKKHRDDCNNS